MRCLDVRLHLVRYLADHLEPIESDKVREHLSQCSPCREYMLDNNMVDRVDVTSTTALGREFSQRVLAAVSPAQVLRPLTRLFIGVCSAAVMFAIAVFVYLRYYLRPGDLGSMPGADVLAPPSAWPEQLLELAQTPLVKYSLYATGAVLIAVVLIALVDFGRQPLDLQRAEAASTRVAGSAADL